MFSECFILDCCAVIAAKTGKFASSVQVNCIHTHTHTLQNSLNPKCAFSIALCTKIFCIFSFYFISILKKNEGELLSRFCHVFLYFIFIFG